MTIGAGIFLIAVGAILKFATNIHIQGISVDTIGVILMIAGAVGLVLGIFQELIWSRRRRVAPANPRWKSAAKSAIPPTAKHRRATSPAPPRY